MAGRVYPGIITGPPRIPTAGLPGEQQKGPGNSRVGSIPHPNCWPRRGAAEGGGNSRVGRKHTGFWVAKTMGDTCTSKPFWPAARLHISLSLRATDVQCRMSPYK